MLLECHVESTYLYYYLLSIYTIYTIYLHYIQGERVLLECHVESWPRAVNYWEKDGRVLAAGAKYEITEEEQGTVQYKFM